VISSSPRELQLTLMQLDADLRKLTSTVHALLHCLPERNLSADEPERVPDLILPVAVMPAEDPVATAQVHWRLRDEGWTLVSPQGQRLPLTTLERKFMLALFAAASRSLARAELNALAPSTSDGREHPTSSPRGVDVMVSRLRRKAQASGMPLPLRSVRRWGYMFTEGALID
jgi:DNA-binding response OmpR family regulator